MSLKTIKFFTSALVSTAIIMVPLAAQAGGYSKAPSYGKTSAPGCKSKPPVSYHPVPNINVYNKNINLNKNININKNINDNKNININKNINDNKNININKNIVIDKGNSDSDAIALAAAIASASANSSSSATVNIQGGANAFAGAGAAGFGFGQGIGVSSGIPESPGPYAGGDIGNIAVDFDQVAHERGQCVYQDSTVVKAIHAVCIAADGHEFPASHMVPNTWIESSYEGEIARCIPGAHLKVVIEKDATE